MICNLQNRRNAKISKIFAVSECDHGQIIWIFELWCICDSFKTEFSLKCSNWRFSKGDIRLHINTRQIYHKMLLVAY